MFSLKKGHYLVETKVIHKHQANLLKDEYVNEGQLVGAQNKYIVHIAKTKYCSPVNDHGKVVLTVFSMDTFDLVKTLEIPWESNKGYMTKAAITSSDGKLLITTDGKALLVSLEDGSVLFNDNIEVSIRHLYFLGKKTPEEYEKFSQKYPDLVQFYHDRNSQEQHDIGINIVKNEPWTKLQVNWRPKEYFHLNDVYVCHIWEPSRFMTVKDPPRQQADVFAWADGDNTYVEPIVPSDVKVFERYDKTIVALDYKNCEIHEYVIENRK